jgi:hypothetical protein
LNKVSISSPLLLGGTPWSSSLPLNIYPYLIQWSFLCSHLQYPMYTVYEEPGSLPSCSYVVWSIYLTHPLYPWHTWPRIYP